MVEAVEYNGCGEEIAYPEGLDISKQQQQQNLEKASKTIEKHIAADSTFPPLCSRLNVNVEEGVVRSGLRDADYPNISPSLDAIKQLKILNKVPIPHRILEHLARAQCHSMMGLFADITRAWITVDSDIFMWNFETGGDVAFYDGVNEAILSVGLVKPKKGIFQEFIERLLVLTTMSHIVVIGVAFTRSVIDNIELDEMQVTPEAIYTVSTEGTAFTVVAGSDNGRIFLAGKDNCLHELEYERQSGWFREKCKKVNHSRSVLSSILLPAFINSVFSEEDVIVEISIDNTRNLLYTLSEKGTIVMYHLGTDGNCMYKVDTLSYTHISSEGYRILGESYRFGLLINLNAIEASESTDVVLVAVSESGARFYFSSFITAEFSSPSGLKLVHVRLPPGYTSNIPAYRPSKVRHGYYGKGTLLLDCHEEGNGEKLWCLSSDLLPRSGGLMETLTVIPLDGNLWAIQRYPFPKLLPTYTPGTPLIARQQYEPASKFICLTSQGVEIVKKLRPVDILAQICSQGHEPGSDLLKQFFQLVHDDSAYAMLLLLACQQSTGNALISEWATSAFLLYAGEPTISNPSKGGFNPSLVSTPISSPRIPERPLIFKHSPKHEALYTYLGRILRPIWSRDILKYVSSEYNIPEPLAELCQMVCNHLMAFHAFLKNNPNICSTNHNIIDMNNTDAMSNKRSLEQMLMTEQKSLECLELMVENASQVLGLWNVLQQHPFNAIVSSLLPQQQIYLQRCKFSDLFKTPDICNVLIKSLLALYLNDNASVDAINGKLREICPSLYQTEDAVCAKASELIMVAKNTLDKTEKQTLLQTSLNMLLGVSCKLNITSVCKQYTECAFYTGLYELCSKCAATVDSNNFAIRYYYDQQNSSSDIYNAYVARNEYYKELVNGLNDAYGKLANITQASQSIINNENEIHDPSAFDSMNDLRKEFDRFLELCVNGEDELIHCVVYEWMMDKGLFRNLLEIAGISLERYLKRELTMERFGVRCVSDLLAKYYEHNNNYMQAASVLYSLATETKDNITLEERMNYLSHALVCIRSNKTAVSHYHGTLHNDIDEMLQIANIQKKIQNEVMQLADESCTIVRQLHNKLFTLTELYRDVAIPYNLHQCKLSILEISTASVYDPMELHDIWESIILNEYEKCVSSLPDDKMLVVTNKVSSILKTLRKNSPVYSLEDLVNQLEIMSCRLGCSIEHVFTSLINIPIALDKLLQVYEHLYTMNDTCWAEGGDEFHIIRVIGFIGQFVTTSSVPHFARQSELLKIQDLITHSLNLLYSKQQTQTIKQLIDYLKNIQIRLSKWSSSN